MARFLVTAQSLDRPGVVAAVSGAAAEAEWSIEDASMTRLAGRFAIMLVLEVAGPPEIDGVRTHLGSRLSHLDIHFTVELIEDEPPSVVDGAKWSVTLYGSDRPGIVSAITNTLMAFGVNIDNLATRASTTAEGHLYTMLIDATVPDGAVSIDMQRELSRVAEILGVTCHAEPVEMDIL